MSGTVLCLVELDSGEIAVASQRALVVASSLADGDSLTAVVFGVGVGVGVGAGAGRDGVAADLARRGASELCVVSSDELGGYAPVAWARALEQLVAERAAVAVVAGATDRGSEVLAHLGALTGLPVAANCVAAASIGDDSWQLVRHRWAGSLLEDAILEAPCALLTVAADAAAGEAGADPAAVLSDQDAAAGSDVAAGAAGVTGVPVVTFTPALDPADLHVCASLSADQGGGMSLATARVVIGGGRGVGGPDGFAALEELAGLLGGVVGVSRVVTSQGWRPHRQQVGQTGTKIAPELYLACGISGAIQHLAGCQAAKHVVAVNTDPDAPIMSRAEYAVIGDLNEVIPALVAAIKEASGRG